MSQVYGYCTATKNFAHYPSEAAWEVQLTAVGATDYINGHLMNQIKEAEIASQALRAAGSGMWGVPRIVFPSIEFLGALYKGLQDDKMIAAHAVDFMADYSTDQAYKKYFPLAYTIYRHGLTHTGMPKLLETPNGRLVGWSVGFGAQNHMRIAKSGSYYLLEINPDTLRADLVSAVDRFVSDFSDAGKVAERLRLFKEGFLAMAKVFAVDDLLGMKARVRACLDDVDLI